MKDWQKGFELDYLKKQVQLFDSYNEFSRSPFSEVKKNNIPDFFLKNEIRFIDDDCVFTERTAKVKSPICMYQNVAFGHKYLGDTIIQHLSFSKHTDSFLDYLNAIKTPVWIESWTEDYKTKKLLNKSRAKLIGTKISTFAELKDYWFIDARNVFEDRDHPKIPSYEFYNLAKLNLNEQHVSELVAKIQNKITQLPEFINHYSNYNKGKSWSAISLRGYRPEPEFMTKPSEMNDKWKKENEHVHFEMQDTTLYSSFEEVRKLVDLLQAKDIHRIRFMKLKGGDGELERHTDLVDVDSGIADGKLMRIHYPIVTNEKVLFNSWRLTGEVQEVNMKIGEAWFLDTRKPHRAINGGTEDRIHLVIDVVGNEATRSLLL